MAVVARSCRRAGEPTPLKAEHWRCSGGSDVTRGCESWSEILATTHLAFDVSATDRTPTSFAGVGHATTRSAT